MKSAPRFAAILRQLCAGLVAALALGAVLVPAASAAPSWQPPFDLSAAEGVAGPQVAVNPDGDAVAVWQRYDGARWIVRAAIRPAGAGWGAPKSISTAGQSSVGPRVSIDDDGNAVAVWTRVDGPSRQVAQSASLVNGAWGPVVNLAGQNAKEPQVAIAAGDVVAVWTRFDGANWIVQAATRSPNGTWGPRLDLSLAGEDAFEPQVDVAGDGDATAVWSAASGGSRVVRAAVKTVSGPWSATAELSSGGDAVGPRVASSADGAAVAVWSLADESGRLVQTASRPAGGSWGAVEDLSAYAAGGADPQVAVNPDGDAVAVWQRGEDGVADGVQAASRPAGGAWLAAADLSGPGVPSFDPRVSLDSDGEAVAVWLRSLPDGDAVQMSRRLPGGSWDAPSDLVTPAAPGDGAAGPQVGVDDGGSAVAVWQRASGAAAKAQASEFAEAPVNDVAPLASGRSAVGLAVTCGPGSWTATPSPSFSYRWLRDGVEVEGATSSSYTPGLADAGAAIGCKVTATNAAGSASAVSNAIPMPAPGLFCAGIAIAGTGTALQQVAHDALWAPGFPVSVCPGGPAVAYEVSSDAAALDAWDADGSAGTLDTDLAFLGVNGAPDAGQVASIKAAAGSGVRLAVVPVAQTAIAVVANPPAGCTVEEITNSNLTALFEGRLRNWSDLATAEGSCASPLTRVVPKGAEAVSAQFKNYLFQLNKKALACAPGKATWQGLVAANASWLESCPEKALSALARPAGSGPGAVASTVAATAGAVGFATLAQADAAGAQTLAVQNNGLAPAAEATFGLPDAGAAANCWGMTYKRPTGGGGLDLDWSEVYGAKPAIGSGAYPLCMLTYVLAFHGYEAAGFGVGQGSTVKDYVNGLLVQTPGQSALEAHAYAPLPTSFAAQFDILGEARKAAAKITR